MDFDPGREYLRGTAPQKEALGRLIASARARKGWQQKELATALRRGQTWVSLVERGLVSLSALEYARIAAYLEIPQEELTRIAFTDFDRPR